MGLPIRPNVLEMRAFQIARPAEHLAQLGSNENPLGPSPRAIEAMRREASLAHRYPDGSGRRLKDALADRIGLPPGQIVLGNGSDELLQLLGLVVLEGAEAGVVTGDPSFVSYDRVAQLAGCRLVKAPLNDAYEFDLKALSKRLDSRARIVFIANPNNPTGTIVRRSALEAFLEGAPSEVLVVLDEAYFEFAEGVKDYPNGVHFVRERANVVVLRTFSKAFGLAGLRCGYAVAQPQLADALERARGPFNLNAMAQAACCAALDDQSHLCRSVEHAREACRKMSAALRAAGADTSDSHANFVWADFHRPTSPICDALLRKGVMVRCGAVFGQPTCLRASAGTESETDRFVRAIHEVTDERADSPA